MAIYEMAVSEQISQGITLKVPIPESSDFLLSSLRKEQAIGKKISDYIAVYQEQLAIGDIRVAYEFLIKYLLTI